MATYPGGVPNLKSQAQIEAAGADGTSNDAVFGIPKMVGDANDEIEAIATELGVNPSGASATVVARLDALDTTVGAKETPAGATSKASAAQSAAEATAAAALTAHHASTSADHDDRYYTEAEVDAAISTAINALIDGAPGALDTLNELAAAMGDDAAFSASVTNALAGKIDKSTIDANSILYGITDNVPAALAVPASRLVARLASGDVKAATPSEVKALLAILGSDVAVSGFDGNLSGATSVQAALDLLDNATFGGGSGISDGDKGDVVVASSGTSWTVENAAVMRILRNVSAVFNVKDPAYGAVGDGSTDDTTAINAAIAALNASTYGGVLYFPAGDYKVTASLTAIAKRCTVRGDGRSEWYAFSESVSKISTTSTTATPIEFNARSCGIEDITIHNKNYAPTALSVSPGLGGFPEPLPTALVGTLPTAGAGVKVTVGDGFHLSNVNIVGFYDNLDQVSGVNVVIDHLHSMAPVRYGHRIRNEAWVDAGGTSIDNSMYMANPKYSQGTTGIRWESGGGLWLTSCGFSGMGAPGGGGSQRTGMAYGLNTNFASAGSSNLQMVNCGAEFVEVGVNLTKGSTYTFFHVQIDNFQCSPYKAGDYAGSSTCGVKITGHSGYPVEDVRISGVFTWFGTTTPVGKGVDLTYCDNVVLDIQDAANNAPATRVSTSNCNNVVEQAVVATTARPGLLPALGGGSTNFLRADGTWAAPPGGGNTLSLYRVHRDPLDTQALSAGTPAYVRWSLGSNTPVIDEIGTTIDPCDGSPWEAFTIPSNGYYRFEAFIGAYDTNRLNVEWYLPASSASVVSAAFASNPSSENWCAGNISTGWRYFTSGTVLKLRVTSEDAADLFGGEAAGWVTVEKRG